MHKSKAGLHVLAFLLYHATLFSQPKTDLFINGLHGKVKKLTSVGGNEYSASSQSWFSSKRFPNTTIIYFNETGNITEENYTDKAGQVFNKVLFEYNDSGYRSKGTRYDDQDSVFLTFTFFYNNAGNKVAENIFDDTGKLVGKIIFTYNSAGREESTSFYFPPDTLQWQEKWIYEDDLPAQMSMSTRGMKKATTYHYYYEKTDAMGNWQKRSSYVVNRTFYQYTDRQIEYY